MAEKIPSSYISGLGYYLRNELFEKWKEEREQFVEPKWNRNYNAFKCISDGYWKPSESVEKWQSKTFVPLTKMKIITAYSIVIDMELQGGKFPFSMIPSPWDDNQDLSPEEQSRVNARLEEQNSIIDQQLMDCNADHELMKCVMSGALYGETYAKRFIHEVERSYYKEISFAPEGMLDPEGQFTRYERISETKDAPAFEYRSNFEVFRDLEEDDIQKSSGICFRTYVSPYYLRQKIGKPYFIKETIKKVLDENQSTMGDVLKDPKSLPPLLRDIKHRKKNIEYIEFWCRVPRIIAEQFEKDIQKKNFDFIDDSVDVENDGDEVEIMAILAADEVVRFAFMQESMPRPVYRAVWELDLDGQGATGVADNVEAIQLSLNGMVRAFEDNKKLSANVIAAVKERYMEDWSGSFSPGTKIHLSEDCTDARQAINQLIIQDVGETLLSGIAIMERYGDEASQLPKIMQGATLEKQKPDTLGEINILQQNAGKYLGGVIKNYDEGLIEPVITDFFHFNMDDPDQQKGKGNFVARALGFSSFQNRIARLQKFMQALHIAMSHEILAKEVKFRGLLDEIFKALDIEPKQALKTDQEKQQDMIDNQRAQQQAIQMEAAAAEKAKQDQIEIKNAEIAAKTAGKLKEEDQEFKHDIIKESIQPPSPILQ